MEKDNKFKSRVVFQTKVGLPYDAAIVITAMCLLVIYAVKNTIQNKIDFALLSLTFTGLILVMLLFWNVYKHIIITDEEVIVKKWAYTNKYSFKEVKGYQLYQVYSHDPSNFIILIILNNGNIISLYKEGYRQYDSYFKQIQKTKLTYLGREEYLVRDKNTWWIKLSKYAALLFSFLLFLMFLTRAFISIFH